MHSNHAGVVTAMKFRNELQKFAFQRFMQRLGLRIDSAKGAPCSYAAGNDPGVNRAGGAVIYDVGANIGQSAIWYAKNFPRAEIFSFEPFHLIYQELVRNVQNHPRIRCQNLALSDHDGEMLVPTVADARCQTGKVIAPSAGEATERIKLRTADSFAEENKIDQIHILKTDTEGFDLAVLAGAAGMLRRRKISHVLAEATLFANDAEHTKLSALTDVLVGHGFRLHGLYDLHHDMADGRLLYFNALFSLGRS